MDASLPRGAVILLDFISTFESNGDYDVIYGNHQNTLSQKITTMTLDQLIKAQHGWGIKWGSSAAGRYQFMPSTLGGLEHTLHLTGSEVFTPGLQDRLGFQLLKGRGYAKFKSGTLSRDGFGKNLAMEWASLPVLSATQGAHRMLARGETYYAGDKLNRALVKPEIFEAKLAEAAAAPD